MKMCCTIHSVIDMERNLTMVEGTYLIGGDLTIRIVLQIHLLCRVNRYVYAILYYFTCIILGSFQYVTVVKRKEGQGQKIA